MVGTVAAAHIPPHKAFVFVPNKLVISSLGVRRSEISHVFAGCRQLFEEHEEAETLELVVFVMYEQSKGMARSEVGERSLWKEYFDVLPKADLIAYWSEEELAELQDAELANEARNYRKCIEAEWLEVQKLLEKYPDIFPREKVTKELFTFAYANVTTRCFEWDDNCVMLVPVADGVNHASVDSSNEAFDTLLHQQAAQDLSCASAVKYATKSRMLIDFGDVTGGNAGQRVPTKKIYLSYDTAAACTNIETLNLENEPYNIWNVYSLS